MKLNTTRVWLGGIAGGVVWNAWGYFIQTRQLQRERNGALFGVHGAARSKSD
jgi:formate/nitrite transporter FocA (FNT family)